MSETNQDPPPRRPPRWGLRALGFLLLGFVAVITAQTMGHHTVGTLGSLVFALLGATWASVNGLRTTRARGIAGLLAGRGPRR